MKSFGLSLDDFHGIQIPMLGFPHRCVFSVALPEAATDVYCKGSPLPKLGHRTSQTTSEAP